MSQKPISALRRRMFEDMAVRRLGDKTQHDCMGPLGGSWRCGSDASGLLFNLGPSQFVLTRHSQGLGRGRRLAQ